MLATVGTDVGAVGVVAVDEVGVAEVATVGAGVGVEGVATVGAGVGVDVVATVGVAVGVEAAAVVAGFAGMDVGMDVVREVVAGAGTGAAAGTCAFPATDVGEVVGAASTASHGRITAITVRLSCPGPTRMTSTGESKCKSTRCSVDVWALVAMRA